MQILYAILVAGIILAAGILLGAEPGAAIVAAVILGFIALGVTYLARLFVNLLGEVDSEKAHEFREWLSEVVSTLHLPFRSVEVVMSIRSGEGYQLVHIASRPASKNETGLLENLILTSATRGEPVAVTKKGVLTVALAGRLASTLVSGIERWRGVVRMRIRTPLQLRLLYKLLRAVYQAARAPKPLAAYSAYKAVGALVREGLVWFDDWRLAERSLSYIPAEPIWLRLRLVHQLRKEQEQLIPP